MSFRVKVTADFSRMKQIPEEIAPIVRDAMRQGARWILEEARNLCPVDTGELRNSIKIRERGAYEFHVVADTEYAYFVEYGTRPHIIRPRKAKVLRWFDRWTGKPIFARYVRHPGTRRQPFLRPAYIKHKNNITKLIKLMLVETVQKGVYYRRPSHRARGHWVRMFRLRGRIV